MTASFPERQSTSGRTIEMFYLAGTSFYYACSNQSNSSFVYFSSGISFPSQALPHNPGYSGRFPGSLGLVMEVALAFPVSQVWLGWGSSGIAKFLLLVTAIYFRQHLKLGTVGIPV